MLYHCKKKKKRTWVF